MVCKMTQELIYLFRSAQQDGIWAWDCVHKELVLIFPTVLALLGDNPMHSEFACHIGLRGKFFCRSCWVKGTDAQDGVNLPNILDDNTPVNSPAPSAHASEDSFEHVPPTLPQQTTDNVHAPKRAKFKESMTAMKNRISAFVKVFDWI
jgi:hypothetical protein